MRLSSLSIAAVGSGGIGVNGPRRLLGAVVGSILAAGGCGKGVDVSGVSLTARVALGTGSMFTSR